MAIKLSEVSEKWDFRVWFLGVGFGDLALDGDFGVGFEEFGGEVGGETADEEKNDVARDDEESSDEEFVGGEEGEIEEIAKERDEKGEGDDGENGEEKQTAEEV